MALEAERERERDIYAYLGPPNAVFVKNIKQGGEGSSCLTLAQCEGHLRTRFWRLDSFGVSAYLQTQFLQFKFDGHVLHA